MRMRLPVKSYITIKLLSKLRRLLYEHSFLFVLCPIVEFHLEKADPQIHLLPLTII